MSSARIINEAAWPATRAQLIQYVEAREILRGDETRVPRPISDIHEWSDDQLRALYLEGWAVRARELTRRPTRRRREVHV